MRIAPIRSAKHADSMDAEATARGLRTRSFARLLAAALSLVLLTCALLSAAASAAPQGAHPFTEKAPKVTKQPVAKTVTEGMDAVFESAASGTPEPTVQWQLSTNNGVGWSPIEGATSATLTLTSVTLAQSGGEYRAVWSSSAGTATSNAVTLTVLQSPAVTAQPASVTVEEGQSASFEAAASGVPAPSVQWQYEVSGGVVWKTVTGGTSDKLTISNTKTTEDGTQYRAVFKNTATPGEATTNAATLTVHKAPAVTKQPVGLTVDEGQNATFEATASGYPTPTEQWEVSSDSGEAWSPIEGATASHLTLTAVTIAQSGNLYRAVFKNAAAEASTNSAMLTVQAPPVVTDAPSSTIVEVGQNAIFEAAASGFPTPTVQWELSSNAGSSWSPIAGATSEQLTVADAQASENGREYRAVFTNTAGKATSAAATLTVATSHYVGLSWGQNSYGQLGIGAYSPFSDVPQTVSGLRFVTAVAAGRRHSLALLANGTVVAWGAGGSGQLGDGSESSSDVPVAVSDLTGVKAIAAGGAFSLALLNNGTVMSWGDNESGELGTGNETESDVPVAVKGLTGVKAIAAGTNYALALLNNGTVMSWGENESGQLGSGGTAGHDSPVAVKGLSGVNAISAGDDFGLALLSNGTVKAWGDDEHGQVGQEPPEAGFVATPAEVGGLSGVTAIAAGGVQSLALLSNGTVMAWGEGSDGELGNGTTTATQIAPVPVSDLSGVAAIAAGGNFSAALLDSGSVMTWGLDKYGMLGDGVVGTSTDVPGPVVGLGKVASISAGMFHVLAFGEAIPTITSVSPKVGPTAGGTTVQITGVDFEGATSVKFGSKEATSFALTSATTAEAVAPPGVPGTVDVTLTTPSGTSPTGTADHFTYMAAPSIKKLSVKGGPATGGTTVVITGTEFVGVTGVSFGSNSATSFEVTSPTSITAVSPAGIGGAANVTVTNTGGSSPISSKDVFKYTPTVESLTPNTGPIAGKVSITVEGSGFAASGTSFKFGKGAATSVVCASATSCTMLLPAAKAAGQVDVIATVEKLKSPVNGGDHFTYE
jgi:alpha-tubulin suppressor-like RCC1 family protein